MLMWVTTQSLKNPWEYWAWWHMTLIPALGGRSNPVSYESEGNLVNIEFQVSHGYIVRAYLKQN